MKVRELQDRADALTDELASVLARMAAHLGTGRRCRVDAGSVFNAQVAELRRKYGRRLRRAQREVVGSWPDALAAARTERTGSA